MSFSCTPDFLENQSHFHMKGYAPGFGVLKQVKSNSEVVDRCSCEGVRRVNPLPPPPQQTKRIPPLLPSSCEVTVRFPSENVIYITIIPWAGVGYEVNLAHYFPYDVKLPLLAHSRSFLANQKARNAIVGAENLLNGYSPSLVGQDELIFNWPSSFFLFGELMTETRSINTRPISSHLDRTSLVN